MIWEILVKEECQIYKMIKIKWLIEKVRNQILHSINKVKLMLMKGIIYQDQVLIQIIGILYNLIKQILIY